MQRFLFSVMVSVIAFGLLWPTSNANSAPRQFDEDPPAHFVLKGAKIFAEGGTSAAWLDNAWIEVRDGKIVRLGTGATPENVKVIDHSGAWIMPGVVSMNSRSFIGTDPQGIGPRYVAADKFNPFANFRASWAAGITSARLGVPGDRFIGGIGSVVKFGGDDDKAVVLRREADLEVSYNDSHGRGEPDIKEIPFPSSSDVPYDAKPKRKPQSRMGRDDAILEVLRRTLSSDAKDPRQLAFNRFIKTGRPLRFDAKRAADIVQAVNFAKQVRGVVPIYLNGLDEAKSVASTIAAAKLSVVLEMDNDLSRLDNNDFDLIRPWRRDPSAAAALEALGVDVIISGKGRDLLYAAAMAVGGGLDPIAAIQAITSRPAKLLGVGDRVGSLTAGKDADFLILNGHPLSSTAHVQEVYVGGDQAWKRRVDSRPLLIRAGKIYDGTGRVYRDSEVLVENGKIVDVGEGIARPQNARVIDAGPNAVVTPGFVDVNSQLGLGSERNTQATDLSLSDVLNVSRPGFEHVARAGVTTVVIGPARTNRSGAQIMAIKTSSVEGELIAKKMVGVKVSLSGSADTIRKGLTGILSKGQKYFETWKKYEDDLAKFKAGGLVAAAPVAATPTAKKGAKPEDSKPVPGGSSDVLSGIWNVTLSGGPIPNPMKNLVAKIRLNGRSVVGTMTNPMDAEEEVSLNGTFDGKVLRAEVDIVTPFGDTTMEVTLDKAEHLVGSINLGGVMDITFDANRTKKGAPKITVKAKALKTVTKMVANGPKQPRFDGRQEPFRAIFGGKGGLMIEVNGGPGIRAAAEVLSTYNLPAVLLGGQGLMTVYNEIGNNFGVALSGKLQETIDNKQVFFPGLLERADVPLAFASGQETGAALLPRLARLAVRSGLGRTAALKALTWDAARLLRLQDTVGAIKKGLDGDLLIFDGEPFDARTRLKSVFIRGQEVKR
ncbi:MAG: imidazolonepropionase-like amidohydrolase [Planctomycetota bacterium]|jgi:imidazolonepropionase-like amidohydrolase